MLDAPVLRIAPHRARADEAAALDGHAGALLHVDDRLDVADDGAGGAVGLDLQPCVGNLARQPLDVADDVRAGAGQPDVGDVDALVPARLRRSTAPELPELSEPDALRHYLEGMSYEQMAEELGCDCKTIDNALQRVKRKILAHKRSREVVY